MVLFNMYGVFFWRFLESRNYKIQIVARVGRKSAVVPSGTAEASYPHFFVGRGFDCQRALLENVELGKFVLIRLQSPREWKNRTRLDGYYFFYYLIPPEDDFLKKKHTYKLVVNCGIKLLPMTKNNLNKKVRKIGKNR